MRNNINGDFSIVEKISELKPGAFININWNKKKLMLPYSLRKDYISFTDKKWDWRYQFKYGRNIYIIFLNYEVQKNFWNFIIKNFVIFKFYIS